MSKQDKIDFFNKELTKTEETKKAYAKQFLDLYKRFEIENSESKNFEKNLEGFVLWCIDSSKRHLWLKSYVRFIKASIKHYLEEQNKYSQEIDKLLQNWKITLKRNEFPPKRGSRMKQRYVSNEDMQYLSNYFFNQKKDDWSLRTWRYCLATLFSGARPCEWLNSKLVSLEQTQQNPQNYKISNLDDYQSGCWLILKNAKHTNGRAHGEFRNMFFGYLKNQTYTDEEKVQISQRLNAIKEHLNELTYFKKNFENLVTKDIYKKYSQIENGWFIYYKSRCSIELRKAQTDRFICENNLEHLRQNGLIINQKTFTPKVIEKRHVSLYSFRHQFSANMKKMNFSREEIAYLMGHKSLLTAATCYAGARVGAKGLSSKINAQTGEVDSSLFNQLSKISNNSLNIEK